MRHFPPTACIALIFLSACTDPNALYPGQREECLAQTTDLGRYGSPGDGFIGSLTNWKGPCIAGFYDHMGNDLVRPTRLTVTFDDLSTGGVTTVTWIGGNISSVDRN